MPKASSPAASMKTRLALIAVLLAVAAVAFMLVRCPTPKPPPPPRPQPEPPPPSTPQAVVVAYIQALEQRDFPAAYRHLSARSRELHPYQGFAAQCEKGAGPTYDLTAARLLPPTAPQPAGEDQATVIVPLLEDPAEPSFTTVREDAAWKVVFIGGLPWSPYP